MKKIVVFYHKNCRDGFASAWVAQKKLKNTASYIAIDYQDDLPKIKNKEVYFIDVTFPKEIMNAVTKDNKVTVIDHHKSQKQIASLAQKSIFNIKHSASILTWKYFFPKNPVPKLLLFIEDIDLWKFKMKGTREIINALDTFPNNFPNWEEISLKMENREGLKDLFEKGKKIKENKEKLVKKLINRGEKIKFHKHPTIIVNSRILASEIGSSIVKKGYPIAVIYYIKDGVLNASLRSDGKTDVSKIAGKYGGGGHKSSAGFFIKNFKKLPWKK